MKYIFTFLMILMLTGCCRVCQDNDCPALSPGCCKPPTNCCCLAKDPCLISKVKKHGIQIERMGDEVLLILPSNLFFYGKSTHLNSNTYPIICDVITLLNCFEKMEIKVAAYTDNCGCVDENLALTKNQATNLVSYMWQHGLDARFVYPVGYGQYCPIANNNTPCGKNRNRRIEITLTHLPPQVSGE